MRKISLGLLGLMASIAIAFEKTTAEAAEIKLLGSVGVRSALALLLPRFEQSSGHKVTALYDIGLALKNRVAAGEAFDVIVSLRGQVDDLINQGNASGASVGIARTGCGLAIRVDAAKPDISTDEKLKAFLLGVKSISNSNPALGGFGSRYYAKTVAEMEIADALQAKTIFAKPGEGPALVAKGEAELGVGLISEIAPLKELAALPLHPHDPASYVEFAGAISATASEADAARALLSYLQSPEAKETFKAQGMTAP